MLLISVNDVCNKQEVVEEQKTDEAKCFCSPPSSSFTAERSRCQWNTIIGNCEIKRNIKNNIDKALKLEVVKKVLLSSSYFYSTRRLLSLHRSVGLHKKKPERGCQSTSLSMPLRNLSDFYYLTNTVNNTVTLDKSSFKIHIHLKLGIKCSLKTNKEMGSNSINQPPHLIQYWASF